MSFDRGAKRHTWSSAVSGWWLERCQCFLVCGCRASPLSVDVLIVAPLPLMLSRRCVIECIFGHANDTLLSSRRSSMVLSFCILVSAVKTSHHRRTPENTRQNPRCVAVVIRGYLTCGPENVQAEARMQVVEGQVSRSHRHRSHFESERGVAVNTTQLISSLVD